MRKHLSPSAAEDLFAFQWPKFARYELEYPEKKSKRGTTSAVLLDDAGPLIVRRGTEAAMFPPRAVEDLHRQFTALGDAPEAVLEFVRKFGFLGLGPARPPEEADCESVRQILDARDHMREALEVFDLLMRMEAKARRARKEMFEVGLPAAPDFDPGEFRQTAGSLFKQWASPRLVPVLVPATDARHGAGLKMMLAPQSLLGSMWLQIAEELTAGAKFRHCERCHKPIRIGPHGGRSDKNTCSDACRQALSKHNRKPVATKPAKTSTTAAKKTKATKKVSST
jgi:predicted nucleic acid-binding Zn ribbon protein